jgi:hypothetical protein
VIHRIKPSLLIAAIALVAFGASTAACFVTGVCYRGAIPMFGNRSTMNIDEVTVIAAMERARGTNDSVEILFTGGSTCNRGIDPKIFSKQTGLTSYNLASNVLGGIRTWYWACQTYLENHDRPRAIVLCLSPVDIMCIEGQRPPTSQDVLDPDDVCERFTVAYGPSLEYLPVAWSRGNRSRVYYADRGLKIGITAFTGFVVPDDQKPMNRRIVNGAGGNFSQEMNRIFKAGGFRPLPEFPIGILPGPIAINRIGYPHTPLPLTHSAMPLANDYVRAYAKLARDHSVKLLFGITPVAKASAFDATGLYAWMRQLKTDFPEIQILTPEVRTYGSEFFWDAHHLNWLGSRMYTPVVAKDVLSALGKTAKEQAKGE